MTRLTIDLGAGRRASARPGDVLLDAALRAGHALPHDCRAGVCGSCRIDVVQGQVIGGDGPADCGVLACQVRVLSDVTLRVPDRPRPDVIGGRVSAVEDLSEDVVAVTIEPRERPWHLPGQYCQFMFHGFPPRAYSPSVPLTGGADGGLLHLHVRRVPGGLVSMAFGKAIRPGHRVRIAGPFGNAVLERGGDEPVVAIGTGTGFAPIWSVVHAALVEKPDRSITVIAGARRPEQAYMEPALKRLEAFPRVRVLRAVDEAGAVEWAGAVLGTPLDVLPPLDPGDLVFAAGAPAMVEAVRRVCLASGARIRADAFGPAPAANPPAPRAAPAVRDPDRSARPAAGRVRDAHPALHPALEPLVARAQGRRAGALARAHLTAVVGVEDTDFGQAWALARRIAATAPCLLVDGRPGGGQGLTDVVCRGVSLLSAVDRPAGSPLHVLPLGTGDAHDVLEQPQRLARLVELLTASYDAIVLSAPPLTDGLLGQVFSCVADIAVVTAAASSDPRARLAAGSLRGAGASEVLVFASGVEPRTDAASVPTTPRPGQSPAGPAPSRGAGVTPPRVSPVAG